MAAWNWLIDGNNAQAVAAVVAGLVALGGLVAWIASRRAAKGGEKTISADRGGVAIGGDATGAKIDTRGK